MDFRLTSNKLEFITDLFLPSPQTSELLDPDLVVLMSLDTRPTWCTRLFPELATSMSSG